MAKQNGSIPISGTIDGITFYLHPEDGALARKKSSLTKKDIEKNDSFFQFRAYRSEFVHSIDTGQLLRRALHRTLFLISDGKLSSRMNGVFSRLTREDTVNDFGERVVTQGDLLSLKGFDFNCQSKLQDVFTGNYMTGRSKQANDLYLGIPSFPATDLVLPHFATHFQLLAGRAIVDFEYGTYQCIHGMSSKMPVGPSTIPDHTFTLSLDPGEQGMDILVMGIAFFARLSDIPRKAISGRRRMKLKKLQDADGMVQFSGAARIVRMEEVIIKS